MKRIIVDYKKLTPQLLTLLSEKFPDGYSDSDIITFDNHHNETIEAVQIQTEEANYLVKVSCKLHYTMTNFDSDNFEVDELGNVIVDPYLNDIVDSNIITDEEE
ncbi:hypothetical protein [Yeosuana sp.]|uniref:hypothetical protein n=1 Tax=Yeosuana sp. TaxID=2529388 RepID=UPI004054F37F|tara:strand:+ start:1353 stop:1664 length:312 start_codon:yes stop_codon:yes gene_type:complete